MPKSRKTRPEPKSKTKRKTEPEPVSITTKKSYWVGFTLITIVVGSVCAYILKIALLNTAILMAAIAVLIGFIGYVRVTPLSMPLNRRATFIFVGACVIGFSIWAAIVLVSNATGFILQIENALGDQFFIVPSLVICLTVGALIGDLIGKNSKVQAYLNLGSKT